MQRIKIKCPLCGQEISKSNYSKHQGRHENHPESFYKYEGDLKCSYCGKQCKNLNSLRQHELRCKENPERKDYIKPGFNEKGNTSNWSKGLTKYNNSSIMKMSISVRNTLKNKVNEGWKPYFATEDFWTEEQRQKMSEQKKKLYREHPEKHPNRKLASNRSNSSYLENLTEDWLIKHNFNYIKQYNTKVNGRNRYVDFYLPDKKLYIEVDGEYWHSTEKDIDEEKDIYAKEVENIDTLRLTSKESIYAQLDKYFGV